MRILLLLISIFVIATTSAEETITFTETNHVALRDIVTTESVAVVKTKVQKLKKGEKLYIFIDSPGGSVIDGLELVSILKTTNKNVVCVARKAISMAFSIFQACPTRIVTDYSILMQHRVSAGAEGNPDQIRTAANLGADLEDLLNKSDSERLKLSIEEFKQKIQYEFWLIGSKKILKNNAADKVSKIECSSELANKEETITINLGFLSYQQTRNLCPL
jgi:ATP-dependent protease ClpP protease subunit